MKIYLRAEGILKRQIGKVCQYAVQCDTSESFYRFPGGSIEFGEAAANAVSRELAEEYDLEVNVHDLFTISEDYFEYGGRMNHSVTMLFECDVIEENSLLDSYIHKEDPAIQLVWRTLEELHEKTVYPEGILEILQTETNNFVHLMNGFL